MKALVKLFGCLVTGPAYPSHVIWTEAPVRPLPIRRPKCGPVDWIEEECSRA